MAKKNLEEQINPDWKPNDALQLWFFDRFKQATQEDMNYEHEQFVDYYLSKGYTSRDWNARFRYWCRLSFKLL